MAPYTAGLPPFSDSTYFGLGLILGNGWRLQNLSLNGYSGVLAYLPQGKVTIALTTTNSQAASLAQSGYLPLWKLTSSSRSDPPDAVISSTGPTPFA